MVSLHDVNGQRCRELTYPNSRLSEEVDLSKNGRDAVVTMRVDSPEQFFAELKQQTMTAINHHLKPTMFHNPANYNGQCIELLKHYKVSYYA